MSSTPGTAGIALQPFTPYQKLMVAMLAFLQFAVILDFMLMAPLGATIMPTLAIGPSEFGVAVSAYAFSAGIAGLLTAGFADRFDRKKMLLFFYGGFVVGTLWCGLAQSFESLLAARIFTGLFGGVIGSVVLAIATDLFAVHQRGRVMGFIQTAFAASQVLGLPIGLYLSNRWSWHMPFLAMAAIGLAGGLIVAWFMRPVADHLSLPQTHSAGLHLWTTVKKPRHLLAFAITGLVTVGGFMLMPFSSAFLVSNVGIDLHSLPFIYLITGLSTIVFGPLIGKAADAIGKFRVFVLGTAVSFVMVLIYTNLGTVSLPMVIVINTVMFVGIFSRIIPFQALMASVPAANERGSFNAVSSSLQQLSGGVASVIAGHIVTLGAGGQLLRYDVVGYIVAGVSLVALVMLWRLTRDIATPIVPVAA